MRTSRACAPPASSSLARSSPLSKIPLGTRLVDSGGGYCSQNVMPVHFGLPADVGRVDVEVTTLESAGRRATLVEDVDPASLTGSVLIVGEEAPR